jgi:hypothetical protein
MAAIFARVSPVHSVPDIGEVIRFLEEMENLNG